MPDRAEGTMPPLLSQTGAFKDVRNLEPSESLIPYDLNLAFWSDGAEKTRWISLPNEGKKAATINSSQPGEWSFPPGTVFVKHFELANGNGDKTGKQRLETRLLVCDSTGGVFGVTYKWRPDNSDADLLTTNLSEELWLTTIQGTRTQAWYYPSREDCRTCHTKLAGFVLGVKTRQLNRDFSYPGGVTDNQLRAWQRVGLFSRDEGLRDAELPSLTRLASPHDGTRSLEERARSWLDANCAHCHRPGGTVANFDARYDTPLLGQNLINGQVLIDEGVDNAAAIAPRDIWRSIIFMRATALDGRKMPPLAHNLVDPEGIGVLKDWINRLPGRAVVTTQIIKTRVSNFGKPVTVTLNDSESGAVIHYTLDGSAPTTSDPLYEKPIVISEPAVLRARAFKTGFTRSVTSQEVFVVTP
jgi:uncharacterized repeat protein (TIGR03806 family)